MGCFPARPDESLSADRQACPTYWPSGVRMGPTNDRRRNSPDKNGLFAKAGLSSGNEICIKLLSAIER
ncbi:MAG: hypothetical protein ACYST3_05375 [Planctomycetota bacterium]